jgi:thymidylate synthase (FAD)
MKIVKQSAQILIPESPMKHIEKIGRICYKSEDKITEGTDKKFVKMLFNNKHHAMLEHYRFIMEVNPIVYDWLSKIAPKHIEFTSYNDRYLISFNARALSELVKNSRGNQFGYLNTATQNIADELITHIIREYDCYELFGWNRAKPLPLLSTGVKFIPNNPSAMSEKEWNIHGWFSAHMITDRGVTHEIVRHREETSFAQESTRYCNYGHDKFGKEITIIEPCFWDNNSREYKEWKASMTFIERDYFGLLNMGATPQEARSVLPTCLKTEIVMTAPIYEWNHFFDLRWHGTTGAPHPMMKELAGMVLLEYSSRI